MTYESIMLLYMNNIMPNFIIYFKIVKISLKNIIVIIYYLFRLFIIIYCKNENEIRIETKGVICCTNMNGYMKWRIYIMI